MGAAPLAGRLIRQKFGQHKFRALTEIRPMGRQDHPLTAPPHLDDEDRTSRMIYEIGRIAEHKTVDGVE